MSDNQLDLALRAARIGFFEIDLVHQKIRLSSEGEALFGYAPGEYGGAYEEIGRRVHPEDLEPARRAFHDSVHHGREHEFTYRIVRPGGEVRWIQTRGKLIGDANGRPVSMIGVDVDITELKHADELRRRAQERLQLVTDAQPTLIAYIDRDYVYRFVNLAYQRWFGRPEGEIIAHSVASLLGSEAFAVLRPYMALGLAGERVEYETWIEYATSGRRYVHVHYLPDTSDDGAVHGIYVSVIDLTERKRDEEALRESEARFRGVFEQAGVGVGMGRPDGRIVRVNRCFSEMLGYLPDELGGMTFGDVIHPDDAEESAELHRRMNAGELEGFVSEKRYRRKTGGFIWARVTNSAVRDSRGELILKVAVMEDITEKRLALEQLQRNEQLLRDSLAQLEDVQATRERFISALTHDLRTPLTTAKMAAGLVRKDGSDERRTEELLRRLIESIDRADRMIGDLLDANRIRAGERLSLRIAECRLEEIAAAVIEDFRMKHGDRIRLAAPARVEGWWSCEDLRRLFDNLVSNALKYGAADSSVTVGIEDRGTEVGIRVHNFGAPIPAIELPRLFEPFRRSREAERGQERGWGIGLALVRGIVEAHGGELALESREGEGTTFRIRLPRDCRAAEIKA